MLIQAKIILILLALMALMGAGGYWYYTHMENKLAASQEKVLVLDIANKAKQVEIDKLKVDIEKRNKIASDTEQAFTTSRTQVDAMRKKLTGKTKSGAPKDLGKAANSNPLIIQNAINRGTADQSRCFEILSGSPLTEEEKNGTVKNGICPELVVTSKSK